MPIPSLLLKQLYTFGSLKNVSGGICFSIKNRLSNARFTGLLSIRIGEEEIPRQLITMDLGNGTLLTPDDVSPTSPVDFPLGQVLNFHLNYDPLPHGKHQIEMEFKTEPYGKLKIKVKDGISEPYDHIIQVPRNPGDDYCDEIIEKRRHFVQEFTATRPEHIFRNSYDPHLVRGNCENFAGVAQVPLGFAGPLTINGEHAHGDFLIPMATTEGTLIASYNRGIKVLNICGGVKCTISADAMQRAPVFIFDDAREARDFVSWLKLNMNKIREEAEATSSIAKLLHIEQYLASKFVYLRFNFSTGDAAGQNMVGRATFAACSWILDHYQGIRNFFLESNFATDKKTSQINIMRTRGKRATAEAVIKRDVLMQHMRVKPESLTYHYGVANVGALLSGANNNGLHSANAITAMFIATGQDVANVAESSAGLVYCELTPEQDLYFSITIPSLIVATYGGGTGLPTQQECLNILGCAGKGKVNKFAEIVAGVVLAGEISLASAISSIDWVSSHEIYGRNR